MDLTVQKKLLVSALAKVQGAAEKRSPVPALANILLEARGSVLKASATNLTIAVEDEVDAKVKKPGSLAVPARDIVDRVRAMPDGDITLTVGAGGTLTLKAPGSARRYTLKGLDGAEYPKLPKPDEDAPSVVLPSAVLSELIALTFHAVSPDETRSALNGALLELEGKTLRMVATDGHRLAKAERTLEGKFGALSLIIPMKSLIELRKICEDEGEIALTRTPGAVFFRAGDTTFSTKLVEAQFPPYQQVIPQNNNKSVALSRVALLDAVRAVGVSAEEKTGGVQFTLKDSKLKLSSESAQSGEGFDELDVSYTGNATAFAVNQKYAIDAFNALPGEEIVLSMNGELDPILVTSEPPGSFTAVLMPMRL